MYDALDVERHEIRLLRILPAQETLNQIECVISPLSLHDDPIYNALSYVWGDPNITITISVNGQPFPATKNLAAALHGLRAKGVDGLLWVDAICIDQSSIEEKNQQVPLMRDIYVKAQKTLVWLGEGSEQGHLAFKLLRRWVAARDEALSSISADLAKLIVNRVVQDHRDEANGIPSQLSHLPQAWNRGHPVLVLEAERLFHETIGASFARRLEEEFDEDEYTALEALRGSPYWFRLWIMQEFALARDIVLLYGGAEIGFELFKDGIDTMIDRGIYGLSAHMTQQHLYLIGNCVSSTEFNLVELRSKFARGSRVEHSFSLWELINLSQYQLASNPLDNIYGLLGLVGSPEFSITVDYSLTPRELFMQLALRFLEHPSVGLDCLCIVGAKSQKDAVNGLPWPTWIPNFANTGFIYDFPVPFVIDSDWELSAEMHVAGQELEVNAVICCSVQDARAWVTHPDDPLSANFTTWFEMMMASKRPHPCGIPLVQAFYRTLKEDASGFGFGRPGFVHDLVRLKFFQHAAGFLEMFALLVLFKLKTPLPPTREQFNEALEDILSAALTPAQFSQIAELEVPAPLRYFAWWLAMSPLKPASFTEESVLEMFCGPAGSPSSLAWPEVREVMESSYHRSFESWVRRSAGRRDSFFTTSDGYMGLGPSDMRAEDLICCIPGCSHPLAIRRVLMNNEYAGGGLKDIETFQIIGACYIYGMMNGEIAADPKSKEKIRRLIFV